MCTVLKPSAAVVSGSMEIAVVPERLGGGGDVTVGCVSGVEVGSSVSSVCPSVEPSIWVAC